MKLKRYVTFLIVFVILIQPSLIFAQNDEVFEIANIPYAWDKGITGKGVKVAVIDSGFENLPELELERLIEFEEITKTSHGTGTASIVRQIAPDAKIYALAHGGKWQGIEKALKWCLENDIDVINMSIGGEAMNSYLQPIYDLDKKGVIMVASAGNSYYDEYYPAYIDGVFSVGGVSYKNGELVKNSHNNADWVDLNFLSYSVRVLNVDGDTRYASGTSVSSPAVAGIFALLRQEYPNTSKNKLFNMLTENGIKVEGAGGIFPVYPTSEEDVPPNPNPEPKPDDSNIVNESREFLDDYKNLKRRLDNNLLDLLMKISEINDIRLREDWFNKVINEL